MEADCLCHLLGIVGDEFKKKVIFKHDGESPTLWEISYLIIIKCIKYSNIYCCWGFFFRSFFPHYTGEQIFCCVRSERVRERESHLDAESQQPVAAVPTHFFIFFPPLIVFYLTFFFFQLVGSISMPADFISSSFSQCLCDLIAVRKLFAYVQPINTAHAVIALLQFVWRVHDVHSWWCDN